MSFKETGDISGKVETTKTAASTKKRKERQAQGGEGRGQPPQKASYVARTDWEGETESVRLFQPPDYQLRLLTAFSIGVDFRPLGYLECDNAAARTRDNNKKKAKLPNDTDTSARAARLCVFLRSVLLLFGK